VHDFEAATISGAIFFEDRKYSRICLHDNVICGVPQSAVKKTRHNTNRCPQLDDRKAGMDEMPYSETLRRFVNSAKNHGTSAFIRAAEIAEFHPN